MAAKKKAKKKANKRAKEFWTTTNTPSGKKKLQRRKGVATRIVAPRHDADSKALQKKARKFFLARAKAAEAAAKREREEVARHMTEANRRGFGAAAVDDSVAAHMTAANRAYGGVPADWKPKKERKRGKKAKAKKSTYVRGRHHGIGSPTKGRIAKSPTSSKPKKAKSPSKGRVVTARELINNAKARVTRSRSGSLKVWTCVGRVRTGCGGGKKGGHVIG